ncbi:MAG: hypothetical protein IJV06_05575 [Bacteroidaceae bacterium]|nr:hypothetical protein [Bacteroidaceae bacterium]
MKNFYSFMLLLAATLLTTAVKAQVINGDLNHNNALDVGDVTLVIDGYLTGETETIETSTDPFAADNQRVVGTWYLSETESITFREDGTTDYLPGHTYKFLPVQGRIIFFNESGIPVTSLNVPYLTEDYIAVLPTGSDDFVIYISSLIAPIENGHEYVDLGLSVKWATMNIGASAPEERGDYFAWGETTAKTDYSWSTYQWCNGSNTTMTKYCNDSTYGTVDNKIVLDLSDDAANANWGGTWRMPTDVELTELREKCTWTWTSLNGVNGMKVIGPSGNSIFFPAAGYMEDKRYGNININGDYWSSSLSETYPPYAWHMEFFRSVGASRDTTIRRYGKSVRAVCP